MNPNDDLNELDYVSSAPELVPKDEPHLQDEADYSTLVEVYDLLQELKAHYRSIDSLAFGDITIENQLIINKKMLMEIQGLESRISNVIRKVKEKQDGRE